MRQYDNVLTVIYHVFWFPNKIQTSGCKANTHHQWAPTVHVDLSFILSFKQEVTQEYTKTICETVSLLQVHL